MKARYILALAMLLTASAHATEPTKLAQLFGSIVQTWTGCTNVVDQLTPGFSDASSLSVSGCSDHFVHVKELSDSWIVVAGNTDGTSALPDGSVAPSCAFISRDAMDQGQAIVIEYPAPEVLGNGLTQFVGSLDFDRQDIGYSTSGKLQ